VQDSTITTIELEYLVIKESARMREFIQTDQQDYQ
jgi:hypothetical protein